MSLVTVQYLKYPDHRHWRLELVRLGADEFGTWLGGPSGTPAQKGDDSPVVHTQPFVYLIPDNAWWTMVANGGDIREEMYVDLASPARWMGDGRVEMLDLDLDIVRLRDGTTFVEDEDEFDLHQKLYGYPQELIDNARRVCAELLPQVAGFAEPFGQIPLAWLEKLQASATSSSID